MNLASLLQPIRALPAYQDLLQSLLAGSRPAASLRIPRSARPTLAAALAQDLPVPVALLVPRVDRLMVLSEEIPAWAPGLSIYPFADPNPLFYERAPWGPRTQRQRLLTLARLTAGRQPGAPVTARTDSMLVIAPARAAMTRTLTVRDFLANSRWLRSAGSIRFDRLLRMLVDVGYAPAGLVAEPGQFSHRGGILDFWPTSEALPVRLEFFSDEIESMRTFDPATQRSAGVVEAVRLIPAREALPRLYREEWDDMLQTGEAFDPLLRDRVLEYFLPWMIPSPTGLLDFLPENSVVLLDDRAAFEAAVGELEEQAISLRAEQVGLGNLPVDAPLPYLTLSDLNDQFEGHQTLDLGTLSANEDSDLDLADAFSLGPRFGGQVRPAMDYIAQRLEEHELTVVVSRQAQRLAELWAETGPIRQVVDNLPADLPAGDLAFVQGALTEGWRLQPAGGPRVSLLTDAEIFGWARPQPRPRPQPRAATPEASHADLIPGDWVVHVDFGIGRFAGLVERTLEGLRREYLLLEYADGDQLFVPIYQADRVTRYIGVDANPPGLTRLGGQEWDRTKSHAREAVEEVARDLLDLYARRMTVSGHAFASDSTWQRELEASFTYVETDDQLRAIAAVKQDMERDRPMDRLVCGDVGYGKTEVALRAAFKAVMDGRQVAILVPTTVLAQQHFNTFRQRLAPFPVEVEMLSRFRTRPESEAILKRLEGGEIDILIGTHRLLQRDVRFKDLGLLVIDEEQRFGVTDKEYLKKLRTEVDVLTMTATPIPRTLYMALTGARDISTINTPPDERLPIITHVGPYDARTVRQAVLREVDRGGQVFFVHNRVQTIDTMRARLERLVPEARVAVGHGQMPEKELAQVMEAFSKGEIDVLLSTSIIESGLDIPNANTLIVDRADTFGLAQLYQLRGRVGRGAARAFAYFFRHPQLRSTEEALQRLEIIAENTQLGAGYSIAMRDLEMRGAGDILGVRQHGQIAAIGFQLYTRLLAQSVRRLRGESGPAGLEELTLGPEPLNVSIELPLPSAFPSEYVPDRELRLNLYRRLADLRSETGLEALQAELADRFGEPPEEVYNLLYQLRVKIRAAAAGVESISVENGQVFFELPDLEDDPQFPFLGPDIRRSKRGLWLTRGEGWRDRILAVLADLRASRPVRVVPPPDYSGGS
jgi:transcription-repair coupling factor (superfamily II helicase)